MKVYYRALVIVLLYLVLYHQPLGLANESGDYIFVADGKLYALRMAEEERQFAITVYDQWIGSQPRRIRKKPDAKYREQIGEKLIVNFGEAQIVEKRPSELDWKEAVLSGILALQQIEGIPGLGERQIDLSAVLVEASSDRYWRVCISFFREEVVYVVDLTADEGRIIRINMKKSVG